MAFIRDLSPAQRERTLKKTLKAFVLFCSQNFDFDLLTPAKLMEKAVGQEVTIVRVNPATGAETRDR